MMRVATRYAMIATISAVMIPGLTASAQSSPVCTLGIISGAVAVLPAVGKKHVAFTATVKFSLDQKLPDGNAIHSFATTHSARDSAGRIRTEIPQQCVRGEDGQPKERLTVSVVDPTTLTSMYWQADGLSPKVVRIFHQPIFKAPAPEEAAAERARLAVAASEQPIKEQTRAEQLGTKTLHGVSAVGVRFTRTIPAGEEGNDLPLEVIRETWTVPELGLTMLRIIDDPRRGRSTFEVEELSLGEPDPALLAAPMDYKIEDQHLNVDTQ